MSIQVRNRRACVDVFGVHIIRGRSTEGTEAPLKGKIAHVVKDSTPDFSKGVDAPKGAPNILSTSLDRSSCW